MSFRQYFTGVALMLLTLSVLVLLTGCNPDTIKNTEVIKYRTITVASLDKSLMRSCEQSEPPSVESYLKKNRDAKEDAMVSYVMLLLKYNQQCSINSLTVKAQYEKQLLNVDAFNEAERKRAAQLYREKTGKEMPDGR